MEAKAPPNPKAWDDFKGCILEKGPTCSDLTVRLPDPLLPKGIARVTLAYAFLAGVMAALVTVCIINRVLEANDDIRDQDKCILSCRSTGNLLTLIQSVHMGEGKYSFLEHSDKSIVLAFEPRYDINANKPELTLPAGQISPVVPEQPKLDEVETTIAPNSDLEDVKIRISVTLSVVSVAEDEPEVTSTTGPDVPVPAVGIVPATVPDVVVPAVGIYPVAVPVGPPPKSSEEVEGEDRRSFEDIYGFSAATLVTDKPDSVSVESHESESRGTEGGSFQITTRFSSSAGDGEDDAEEPREYAFYVSLPEDKANWFEAFRRCGMRGMELVSLENSEKSQLVESILRAEKTKVNPLDGFWTSGYNMVSEDPHEFSWAATGEAFGPTFSNWQYGSPSFPSDQNCVEIMEQLRYKWTNQGCHTKARFICQALKWPHLKTELNVDIGSLAANTPKPQIPVTLPTVPLPDWFIETD